MPGWSCLALLIGFAALRSLDPAPVEELRVRTFDTFQRVDPRVKTARPVTIVDIDDKSLEKLGQWPWPRTRIADLVTKLTRLGAVVIAFDVVFSEPDRLNPDIRRRHLPQSRRGDPRQAARAAEQRPDFRRCHRAPRAWCWANPDRPMNSPRSTRRFR